jgi:hypothetical protein
LPPHEKFGGRPRAAARADSARWTPARRQMSWATGSPSWAAAATSGANAASSCAGQVEP